MFPPKPLDAYSEDSLRTELRRRKKLQDLGLCDYCERGPDTRHCQFPSRHMWNHPDELEKRILLELLPYYDVEDRGIITQAIKNGESRQNLFLTMRDMPGKPKYSFEVRNCSRVGNLEISPDRKQISAILITDRVRV